MYYRVLQASDLHPDTSTCSACMYKPSFSLLAQFLSVLLNYMRDSFDHPPPPVLPP
jgi:hypothetical protein